MFAVLLAILLTAAAGVPLVLLVDPRARGGILAGLAFLYGTALVYAVLLILSLLHIPWSLWTAGSGIAVLAVIAALARRRPAGWSAGGPPAAPWSFADLPTLYVLLCFTLFATAARLWQWDFWAIWGLKARVFAFHRGVDWAYLRSPWNDFCHPDYPLLVPLNYDWAAILGRGYDDRWLGFYNVAFGVALLLIVRSMLRRELPRPWTAALIALASCAFALSWYIGLAEGALIACSASAVLFIRRALMDDDHTAMRHGAILLGLAASCKNEGLAIIASIALVLFFLDRRRVLRLWPAVAIAVPWLVIRAAYGLSTDIARGSFAARLVDRLGDAPHIFLGLLVYLPDLWMWLLLLLALLVIPREERRRERFVLYWALAQLAVYIAVYFGTPRDVDWHIGTSWPRLTRQLGVPVVYAVMVALARVILSRADGEGSQNA